ncbi:MAG: hypothetical protein WC732_06475 [Candidatus Omnitrophota bacterium]
MEKCFLRVAQELDYDVVSSHLLIVGELTGDCFTCRQVGIDYSREKYCSQCGTDFRYISLRKSADAVKGGMLARICQKRPDLTYVEYSDVKEIADRRKAKDFFK